MYRTSAAIFALCAAACVVAGASVGSAPGAALAKTASNASPAASGNVGIRKCQHPVAPSSDVEVVVPGSSVEARVLTFRWDGNVAVERIPPANWKPATASAPELRFFSIDPRPKGGAALRDWKTEWIDEFTAIEPGTPCADALNASAAAE